jgi:hypothetical protein
MTKDFNPEKYEALCKILCKKYRQTGNPAAMLVEVVANDSCGAEAAQISQSSEVKCTYLSNIKLFL